jgi:hypothetical protein
LRKPERGHVPHVASNRAYTIDCAVAHEARASSESIADVEAVVPGVRRWLICKCSSGEDVACTSYNVLVAVLGDRRLNRGGARVCDGCSHGHRDCRGSTGRCARGD